MFRLLCLSGNGSGNIAITVQMSHVSEFDSKPLNLLGIGEFSMFKLATKSVVHARMGSRRCESFIDLAWKLMFLHFHNWKTLDHHWPEGLEPVKTWKCWSPSCFSHDLWNSFFQLARLNVRMSNQAHLEGLCVFFYFSMASERFQGS